MGANDLDGMNADQRIATVTAQTRQASEDSTDKTIGEVSHDGSLAAALGAVWMGIHLTFSAPDNHEALVAAFAASNAFW